MSFSLFPKAPKFFEHFREQNRIIAEAATVLDTIVHEYGECDVRCQIINRLESEGDAVNRTIARALSTTFITPLDREDIHDLNVSQEAILNHIQAISNRIGVYDFARIRFPARRMIGNLKAMVMEIGVLLAMLGEKKDINQNLKIIKDLKNECETLMIAGLAELYENPPPNPAEILEIMKWSHVYDRIDKAVIRTWVLAKTIEGIVLKNA